MNTVQTNVGLILAKARANFTNLGPFLKPWSLRFFICKMGVVELTVQD